MKEQSGTFSISTVVGALMMSFPAFLLTVSGLDTWLPALLATGLVIYKIY